MAVALRGLLPDDWPAVTAVYAQGLASGSATFETEVPEWPDWDDAHLATGRIVADEDGRVVGFTALTPVSPRRVYRGVAEVSVYVAADRRGRGVGRLLLAGLIDASEGAGLWTLQSTVFTDNEASLRLHSAAGFRIVGVRERLAQREGVWHDVVLFERRSLSVGV